MRAGEATISGASDNGMQSVTEFVEQGFHFLMRQQRRLVGRRWREIAEQRHGGTLIFSVWQEFAPDNFELGEVIELPLAREHVQIKQSQRFAAGGIGDDVELQV